MGNINERLCELYNRHWKELVCALAKTDCEDYAAPYVMKVDEAEYESADIRLLFVGQETFGWGWNGLQLNSNMNAYYDFIYSGKNWDYGGFFWGGLDRFISGFCEQLPPNRKVASTFTNVLKIGRAVDTGAPPPEIIDQNYKYLDVLKEEIEILNPSMIIFLTGPNYDHYIKRYSGLNDLHFFDIPNCKLAWLNSMQIENIPYSFRTYHPTTLHFKGNKNYTEYFQTIYNSINFNEYIQPFKLTDSELIQKDMFYDEQRQKIVQSQQFDLAADLTMKAKQIKKEIADRKLKNK